MLQYVKKEESMKTIKLLINTICVSVFTLFLLGAACGVPVDTSDSYYIKFKVDGVQKNYERGSLMSKKSLLAFNGLKMALKYGQIQMWFQMAIKLSGFIS
jgi:hypothetical protein